MTGTMTREIAPLFDFIGMALAMYLHRQSSGMMLLVLLLPVAVCAIIAWTSRAWWIYLLAVVLVLVAWLFSSLTIAGNDSEVVSGFGPGFWRKRVPLGDIVNVERTTFSALEGWGIRITPRGMLYNVAGRDAVEIRLATGRRFRFGTDDADGLVAALRSQLPQESAP
jgi:hypothetical protein